MNRLPRSIILIRHGDNLVDDSKENNLLELSSLGVKQANWAFKKLYNSFDVVFSSTSKRCVDTAKIISKDMNIILSDDLLEKGYGNNKSGNETLEEARYRFKMFFLKVCQNYSERRVLFVIHGTIMKLAQDVIEENVLERKNIDNCQIIKYEIENDNSFEKIIMVPFD